MSPDRLSSKELPAFAVENVYIAGNKGPCGGVRKIFSQLDVGLEVIGQLNDKYNTNEKLHINWHPVNNFPVTEEYEAKGLFNFKNDWSKVPRCSLVIPSPHGVAPDFYEMAGELECTVLADGSCQLVTRVHQLVIKAENQGKFIVYIGKAGHPETIGVMGEVRSKNIVLIEEDEDVGSKNIPLDRLKIVYSQTTLSTRDVRSQYQALRQRFPNIEIPPRWDICYATDTRQTAVEQLMGKSDLLVVVGSTLSHNSTELKMIGDKSQKPAFLIDYPSQVDPFWFSPDVQSVAVSSGASAPDYLMYPVVERIVELNKGAMVFQEDQVVDEDLEMVFKYDAEAIKAVAEDFFRTKYAA